MIQAQYNQLLWKECRVFLLFVCSDLAKLTLSNSDAEHSIPPLTMLKRRAQALIIFVGLAIKPKKTSKEGQNPISHLVAQLIALAAANTDPSAKLDDTSDAARSSLNRLLNNMSVIDFVESVQSILLSEDVKVLFFIPSFEFSLLFGQIQSGAFDVLAKRLPDVSAEMRPNVKDNIKQILQSTKNFLHVNKHGEALTFAFQALESIADTLCTGEEGSLADVVPYVLSSMNDKDLVSSSLSALTSISSVFFSYTSLFF
jgi:U3 small nucleolar RNA-associated protein 10